MCEQDYWKLTLSVFLKIWPKRFGIVVLKEKNFQVLRFGLGWSKIKSDSLEAWNKGSFQA